MVPAHHPTINDAYNNSVSITSFKDSWIRAKTDSALLDGVDPAHIAACQKLAREGKLSFLTWHNITVTVKQAGGTRAILRDLSGSLEPRQILALMGPSGSGKSTLLDTLAGRLGSSTSCDGQVLLNGQPSNLSYGTAAYVTQEDLLIGTLTVWETLMAVAELRLPRALSKAERRDTVASVVAEMGLDDCKDTYVGNWMLRGISGGQKRRVSLACELLTSPNLLFLDEPTSGLDSAAAYQVVSYIKRLSSSCRSVIMSIHQPSSEVFALCDVLCLLATGRLVYFGAASGAASFFEGAGMPVPAFTNPADHYLSMINCDFGADKGANVETLCNAFLGSADHSQLLQMIESIINGGFESFAVETNGPTWMHQTWTLTCRTLKNNIRDIGIFWIRLAMYAMLCICLGFVFFQLDHSWKSVFSRAALLFFVVAFLTFMAIAAFPAFVEDMKIFVKERLNGYYGVSQFVVANTLSAVPFIFLITVVSTFCVYYLASLNTASDRVIYFVLDLFFSLLVTESMFMAVAPLMPNFLAGIAVGAGFMGLFMIVCGFFQPTAQLPKPVLVYPLHYISFITYAFFGFMHNEFDGVNDWGCPCSAQPSGCAVSCSFSGQEVLEYYNVGGLSKWTNLAIIGGMTVAYRLIFFATLKLKERLSK